MVNDMKSVTPKTIQMTEEFDAWLSCLSDATTKAIITARLLRVQAGNMGDVKPIGAGISELRIDHGPGYRVYLKQKGSTIVFLLNGGEKSSQKSDIAKAHKLAKTI